MFEIYFVAAFYFVHSLINIPLRCNVYFYIFRATLDDTNERFERLRAETTQVFDELKRLYEGLKEREEQNNRIAKITSNIERKIAAIKNISSFSNFKDILEDDLTFEEAQRRHKARLFKTNKNWWDQLDKL